MFFPQPRVTLRPASMMVGLVGLTRPPLNVVISNVPGPRDPLYLAGAQMQANYPVSVIVDGVGLNMTVMSYRDHMDFGIVADREQVDDVWSLMDTCATTLEEFEHAVFGRHSGNGRASRGAARRAVAR